MAAPGQVGGDHVYTLPLNETAARAKRFGGHRVLLARLAG